jgi:histidine triad (HIT) family protein
VRGEIPAKAVYRDAEVMAIEDINPQAPVHLLVLPLAHFGNVGAVATENRDLLGQVAAVAAKLGGEYGFGGYRLVVNTGADGGQSVDHMHMHVLAGRLLEWPPG